MSFSLVRSDDNLGIELDFDIDPDVDAAKLEATDEDDADLGMNDATPLRIASTPECRNPNLEVAPLAEKEKADRHDQVSEKGMRV